jgi:hypothetical protein
VKLNPFFAALAAAALVAFSAVPEPVRASPPLLPLELGNHWDYVGISGAHQVETITGTETILGRTVFVKSYAEGLDAGLENFWLTGPGGEVMLAGFDTHDGLGLAYDPPITVCGGAPSLGDTWPTHTTAYNLADMSVFATIDITFSALEEVTLTVPAGTFDCIGVGQVAYATSPERARIASRGLTLDGRQVAGTRIAASTSARDWFSPGVGDVQYITNDTFQLASYGTATPALTSTWGTLKALYRP